jgi:hypothetical protein
MQKTLGRRGATMEEGDGTKTSLLCPPEKIIQIFKNTN